MANCKDIVVDIQNYISSDTYTVVLRKVGSIVDSVDLLPTYTAIATGPQVIFKNLPDGLYEVQITRACITGGISKTDWMYAASADCPAPVSPFVDNITGTTAKLNWTGSSGQNYEYSMDGGKTWAATTDHTHHDLTGLTSGRVYIALIRRKCGAFLYSIPVRLPFTATTGSPAFTVQVLDKVCTGNTFEGYKLRFSFAGGLAPVNDIYRIRFTDYLGNTSTLLQRTVTGSDTLTIIMKEIANTFTPENLVIGSNFASFDTVVKELKNDPAIIQNCQDVNSTTGFLTDIL